MMKGKKSIALLLVFALLLSLTACGNTTQTTAGAGEKPTIKVYCWSEHMIYSGYAAYVQSQIPEADVVFVTGQNSMSYYEFMRKNDSLPDILTVRRMSMIDAENLREDLMDLSETEVAAGFNNIYLENYRFEDGTINWLPACGEVDGYIINKDLFDKYHVELPTDRASFDKACEIFKEEGIIPYSNDFGMDYTCLETLQGLSIQELMTGDGIEWRTAYESGSVHQLEETIWPQAFERLEHQLKVWETPGEAAEYNYEKMFEAFEKGRAAMMRGTGNDVIDFKEKGMNVGMLPYFGDTPDDSWLLTYPSFNVAVNKSCESDPDKEALCMKVLEEMFSEKAQNILAGNHNTIPYNVGVTLDLDESMQSLVPYINQNHLYLRLASREIFEASHEAVRGMVTGEFSAAQAYDAFNEVLAREGAENEEVVIHFDKGYKNEFSADHGNEAASVMTNTLKNYFGSDIVIAHGVSYSGIVYADDYTETKLNYMVTDTTIKEYTTTLTGAEVKALLEAVLTREFGGVSAINRYSLPILSGCEMTVTEGEDGYQLQKLTIDGKEIDDDNSYSVTYIGSRYQADPMMEELYAERGGRSFWNTTEDLNVRDHWKQCVLGSENNDPIPLAEPTDYIDLIQE